ncbi:amino acid ABC transporter permease [Agromyces sp. SYSU K20354]|uniref:amino acid ABC transporter permease n=1 Tax=Agromyces cavernae TaxID=2898659 RepID=UPI001E6233F8|nr:amino acid ABC transporter permease [Agromyces cavernae]MCD2443724.1 amino acid ABC transporter permease [Agromyces cavernae]
MSNSGVLFDAPGPRARRLSVILSWISGVVLVGLVSWGIVILNTPRESGGITLPGMFDPSRWDILADPVLWNFVIFTGVWNTLRAAIVAAVLAVALGVVLSLMRSSPIGWVRIPTMILIEFFRGMPVLLMMLFILLVAGTGQYWAVVLALAVYNGALIGEALRAGLVSLPRGQREAALSLGMRPLQSKMLVEFPQAFRQMLPIIVAQLVVLLKDTSLGYIVGYQELLRVTLNNLGSFYGNRYLFTLWCVAFVLYLIMNLSLSWFARWLSKRTASKSSGKRLDPADAAQAMLKADAMAESRQTPQGG